jgi:hypothetical protein
LGKPASGAELIAITSAIAAAFQPASLYHDGQWFHVYCFKEAVDAQKFMERFGGEKFNPIERGRGANWATWRKS